MTSSPDHLTRVVERIDDMEENMGSMGKEIDSVLEEIIWKHSPTSEENVVM